MTLHYLLKEGFINVVRLPLGTSDEPFTATTIVSPNRVECWRYNGGLGWMVKDKSTNQVMLVTWDFLAEYGVDENTVNNLDIPHALQALQN